MTITKKKKEKKRQPVANLVRDYLPGNFYSEPDQNIVEDVQYGAVKNVQTCCRFILKGGLISLL